MVRYSVAASAFGKSVRAVPASGMNTVSPQNNASPPIPLPTRYATASAVCPGAAITATSSAPIRKRSSASNSTSNCEPSLGTSSPNSNTGAKVRWVWRMPLPMATRASGHWACSHSAAVRWSACACVSRIHCTSRSCARTWSTSFCAVACVVCADFASKSSTGSRTAATRVEGSDTT
jgi:hypothetical protein